MLSAVISGHLPVIVILWLSLQCLLGLVFWPSPPPPVSWVPTPILNVLIQELNENPIPTYVIVWDNVSFHQAAQVREWFNINGQFMNLYLPPYSPFLKPIEELFSSWRWKVYDRQPYTRINLLQAMDLACGDIGEESCQGWIRHTRDVFPHYLRRDSIACDVDEVLWPDPAQRQEEAQ